MASNIEGIWKEFPGCECLKIILINSGYDNLASLKSIDSVQLIELEKYVEDNRSIIHGLSCNHKQIYEKKIFEFLPGHRVLILKWCVDELKMIPTEKITENHPAFSPILREIIHCALSNHIKPPNRHRFSEMLMNFSIYIYIMAGKAAYEILCANLPLPKAKTISKSLFNEKNILVSNFVHIFF